MILPSNIPTVTYANTSEDNMPASTVVTSYSPLNIEPCIKDNRKPRTKQTNKQLVQTEEIVEDIDIEDTMITAENKLYKKPDDRRHHAVTVGAGQIATEKETHLQSDTVTSSFAIDQKKTYETEKIIELKAPKHKTKRKTKITEELTEEEEEDKEVKSTPPNLDSEVLQSLPTINELECTAVLSELTLHRPSISETLSFLGPKEDELLKKHSIIVVEEDTSTDYDTYVDEKDTFKRQRDAGISRQKPNISTDTKSTQEIDTLTDQYFQLTRHVSSGQIEDTNPIVECPSFDSLSSLDIKVKPAEAIVSLITNKHLLVETPNTQETSNSLNGNKYSKCQLIPDVIPSLATDITEVTTLEKVAPTALDKRSRLEKVTETSIIEGTAIQVQENEILDETSIYNPKSHLAKRLNAKLSIEPTESHSVEQTMILDAEKQFNTVKNLEQNIKSHVVQEKLNSLIIAEASELEGTDSLQITKDATKEAITSETPNTSVVVEQPTVHDTTNVLQVEKSLTKAAAIPAVEQSVSLIVENINTGETASTIADTKAKCEEPKSVFDLQQPVLVYDTDARETVIPSTDMKYRTEQALLNYSITDAPLKVQEVQYNEKETDLKVAANKSMTIDSSITPAYPLQTLETFASDSFAQHTDKPSQTFVARSMQSSYEAVEHDEPIIREKEKTFHKFEYDKSQATLVPSSALCSLKTQEILTNECPANMTTPSQNLVNANAVHNLQESICITDQPSQIDSKIFNEIKPIDAIAIPGVRQQESLLITETQVDDKENAIIEKKPLEGRADVKCNPTEVLSVYQNEIMVKEGEPTKKKEHLGKATINHAGSVVSISISEPAVHESIAYLQKSEPAKETSVSSYEEQVAAQVKEVIATEKGLPINIEQYASDSAMILDTALVSDHITVEEMQASDNVSQFESKANTMQTASPNIIAKEGIIISEVQDISKEKEFTTAKNTDSHAIVDIESTRAIVIQNTEVEEGMIPLMSKYMPIKKCAHEAYNENIPLDISEVKLVENVKDYQQILHKGVSAKATNDKQEAVTVCETEAVFPISELLTPKEKTTTAHIVAGKNDSLVVDMITPSEKEAALSQVLPTTEFGQLVSNTQDAVYINEHQLMHNTGIVEKVSVTNENATLNIFPQKALTIEECATNIKEDKFQPRGAATVNVKSDITLIDTIVEVNETRPESPVKTLTTKPKEAGENAFESFIENKSIAVTEISSDDKETPFKNDTTLTYQAKLEDIPGHIPLVVSQNMQNQKEGILDHFSPKHEMAKINLKGLKAADVSEIIIREHEGDYNKEQIKTYHPDTVLQEGNICPQTEEINVGVQVGDFKRRKNPNQEQGTPNIQNQSAVIIEEVSVQEKESCIKPRSTSKTRAAVSLSNEHGYLEVSETQASETPQQLKEMDHFSKKTAVINLTEPNKTATKSKVIVNEKENLHETPKPKTYKAKSDIDFKESVAITEVTEQSPIRDLKPNTLLKPETSNVAFVPSIASSITEINTNERESYEEDLKAPTVSLETNIMSGENSIQVRETFTQDSVVSLETKHPLSCSANTSLISQQTSIRSDVLCAEKEKDYISEKYLSDVASVNLQEGQASLEITEQKAEPSLGVFKTVMSAMGHALQTILPQKAVEIYSTLTTEKEGNIEKVQPTPHNVSPSINGTMYSIDVTEVLAKDKESSLKQQPTDTEQAVKDIVSFQAPLTKEILLQEKEGVHMTSHMPSTTPKTSTMPASYPVLVSEVSAETNISDYNVSKIKEFLPKSSVIAQDSIHVEMQNIHEKERDLMKDKLSKKEAKIEQEPSHPVALTSNMETLEGSNVLHLPPKDDGKVASISVSGQTVAQVSEYTVQDSQQSLPEQTRTKSVANSAICENISVCVSATQPEFKEESYKPKTLPKHNQADTSTVIVPLQVPSVSQAAVSEQEYDTKLDMERGHIAKVQFNEQLVLQVSEEQSFDNSKDFESKPISKTTADICYDAKQPLTIMETETEMKEGNYVPKSLPSASEANQSTVLIPLHVPSIAQTTTSEQECRTNLETEKEHHAILQINEQPSLQISEEQLYDNNKRLQPKSTPTTIANVNYNTNIPLTVIETETELKEGRYERKSLPEKNKASASTVVVPLQAPNIVQTTPSEKEHKTGFEVEEGHRAKIQINEQPALQISQEQPYDNSKNFDSKTIPKTEADMSFSTIQPLTVTEISTAIRENELSKLDTPSVHVDMRPVIIARNIANTSNITVNEQEGQVNISKAIDDTATCSISEQRVADKSETLVHDSELTFTSEILKKASAQPIVSEMQSLSISEVVLEGKETKFQDDTPILNHSIIKPVIVPLNVANVSNVEIAEQEGHADIKLDKSTNANIVVPRQDVLHVEQCFMNEKEAHMNVELTSTYKARTSLPEMQPLSVEEIIPDSKEGKHFSKKSVDTYAIQPESIIVPLHLPNVAETDSKEREGFVSSEKPSTDIANISYITNTPLNTSLLVYNDKEKNFNTVQDLTSSASPTVMKNTPLTVSEVVTDMKEGQLAADVMPQEQRSHEVPVLTALSRPSITEAHVSEREICIQSHNETGQAHVQINEQKSANVHQVLLHEKERNLEPTKDVTATASPQISELQSVCVKEVQTASKEGSETLDSLPLTHNVQSAITLSPMHAHEVQHTRVVEKEGPCNIEQTTRDIAEPSLTGMPVAVMSGIEVEEKEHKLHSEVTPSIAEPKINDMQSINVTEVQSHFKEEVHASPQTAIESTNLKPVLTPMLLPNVAELETHEREVLTEVQPSIAEKAQITISGKPIADVRTSIVHETISSLPDKLDREINKASVRLQEQQPLTITEVNVDNETTMLTETPKPNLQQATTEKTLAPFLAANVGDLQLSEETEILDINQIPQTATSVTVANQPVPQVTHTLSQDRENDLILPQKVDSQHAKMKIDECKHLVVTETCADSKPSKYTDNRDLTIQLSTSKEIATPLIVAKIETQSTMEQEDIPHIQTPLKDQAGITVETKDVAQTIETATSFKEESLHEDKNDLPCKATITREETKSLIITEQLADNKEQKVDSFEIPERVSVESMAVESPMSTINIQEKPHIEKESKKITEVTECVSPKRSISPKVSEALEHYKEEKVKITKDQEVIPEHVTVTIVEETSKQVKIETPSVPSDIPLNKSVDVREESEVCALVLEEMPDYSKARESIDILQEVNITTVMIFTV